MYFNPLNWLFFDCSRGHVATFWMQKKVVGDWIWSTTKREGFASYRGQSHSLKHHPEPHTHARAEWSCMNHVVGYHVFSASRMLLHGLLSNQKSTSWQLKYISGITRGHLSFNAQNLKIIRSSSICNDLQSLWVLYSSHCDITVLIRRYKATSFAQLVVCLLLNK